MDRWASRLHGTYCTRRPLKVYFGSCYLHPPCEMRYQWCRPSHDQARYNIIANRIPIFYLNFLHSNPTIVWSWRRLLIALASIWKYFLSLAWSRACCLCQTCSPIHIHWYVNVSEYELYFACGSCVVLYFYFMYRFVCLFPSDKLDVDFYSCLFVFIDSHSRHQIITISVSRLSLLFPCLLLQTLSITVNLLALEAWQKCFILTVDRLNVEQVLSHFRLQSPWLMEDAQN